MVSFQMRQQLFKPLVVQKSCVAEFDPVLLLLIIY